MKTSKWMAASGALMTFALAFTWGCHGGGQGDEGTVSVGMAFTGPDFSYNSVRICGDRSHDADHKYPCRNHLKGPNDYECPCFNFDADGKVYGESTDHKKVLDDLCPSDDLDEYGHSGATWSFEYTVFVGQNCQAGNELTGTPGDTNPYTNNPHNFICYDFYGDLATRYYPNETHEEELYEGKNVNHIICLTKNAEKKFDFDVCVVLDQDYDPGSMTPPPPSNEIKLDCGCYFDSVANKCVCDQGFDPAALPSVGCSIDETYKTCHITCG